MLFAVSVLLFFSSTIFAGNIDPAADGHRYAYGENIGWIDFAASQDAQVTVNGDAMTGHIWGEKIGWIDLNGVSNDGSGNLSGYAWGESVGWVSFSCSNDNSCSSADYGVKIDPDTGVFSGKALGEKIGWISFDLQAQPAYVIVTEWRGTVLISLLTGSVFADIAGYTGLGVRSASVSLEGTSYSAVTDDNGNFTFTDVQPGSYTLVITSPDFAPIRKQVTVSGSDLGATQMYVYKKGDVTGDGKVGLPEAIHALQVISGVKSE